MSNDYTTNLLERAQQAMTYYEGTILEEAIQNNLDTNDLDTVAELVNNAEVEMAREEYYAHDL